MRRREPTLDPAVAAELEALEAALAGDPAAEPELAALVRDVRAEAPAMEPASGRGSTSASSDGFAKRPPPRRRFALRPLIPALGVAGCVLAAIVAIALTSGGGRTTAPAAAVAAARRGAAPPRSESSDSAKSSSGSSGQQRGLRRSRRRPRRRPRTPASAASSAARAWS